MIMTKLKKAVAEPQPFVVKRSGIQGKGGFALRDIRKGERLIEYVGERISWKDADARYDDEGMGRHHTFLFSVTRRTVIDAAFGGNDSRFINHSCDPNCEAVDEKNRIFIEAIKPIGKGVELTYDYSYEREKNTTEEDEKLYVCRCGTAKCRGTILVPLKKKVVKTRHAAARQHGEASQASTTRRVGGSSTRKGSKKSAGRTSGKSAKKRSKRGTGVSGAKEGRGNVRRRVSA
jgi:hypothetical protein